MDINYLHQQHNIRRFRIKFGFNFRILTYFSFFAFTEFKNLLCANSSIKLNDDITRSDKDEQEGFKFLYMGAMKGIRNPKAHENIIQDDKNRTLEYLAFISLLFRRAEEGKIEKNNNKS